MTGHARKLEYSELTAGYEFPPVTFALDADVTADYLDAVTDDSSLYRDGCLVPPMVVAARAMAALANGFSLPPGAIHVSQELEFKQTVAVGENLTSRSRVERKQDRGKFHMLTIGLTVVNGRQETVVTSKTSFILPVEV